MKTVKISEATTDQMVFALATLAGYSGFRKFEDTFLMDPPRKEYGGILFYDLTNEMFHAGRTLIRMEQRHINVTWQGATCVASISGGFLHQGNSLALAVVRCYLSLNVMGDMIEVPDELS